MCETPIAFLSFDGMEVNRRAMPCKKWSCPDCYHYRLKELQRLALAGKPERFITLTVNPTRYETPHDAARDLKRAFDSLKKAIKRELGIADMQYMVVVEKTKKGWPHFHILQRGGYIPQDWLSAKMRSLAAAPIVDIRQVKDEDQAAAYVSKYVSKSPERFAGCKRYWTSRNWIIVPELIEKVKDVDDRYFGIVRIDREDYFLALARRGISEEEVRPGVFVWRGISDPDELERVFIAVLDECAVGKGPAVPALADLPPLERAPPAEQTAGD